MAPAGTKETTKMKHTTEHGEPAVGSHGHHGKEEDKAQGPHNPVLVEKPGASSSTKLDGNGLRVTIVAARWYEQEVRSLVQACSEELLHKGVAEDDLHLIEVTGAFELPYAAARIIHCKDASHRPDAVICIGCIVKDGTYTSKTMSLAVAHGIMKLNVTSDVPVIFGVLCCKNEQQAHACTTECVSGGGGCGKKCNHGVSWAQSALELAHLKHCMASKKGDKCCCSRCESRSGGSGGMYASGKHGSETADECTRCGSSPGKCSCLDCNCRSCCSKRGECGTCGSTSRNCSCKDCKCKVCCANREACRSCGCPPDTCSCDDCNCSSCSSKKAPTAKSSHAEASKHHPETSKHQESSPSSAGAGSSKECASCGSPGGKCKCGLLH